MSDTRSYSTIHTDLTDTLRETVGGTVAFDTYDEVSLLAAELELAAHRQADAPDSDAVTARTDAVSNAVMAVWHEDDVLTESLLTTLLAVLGGDRDPDDADLPMPSMGAFRESKQRHAEKNPELEAAIEKLNGVVTAGAIRAEIPGERGERLADRYDPRTGEE